MGMEIDTILSIQIPLSIWDILLGGIKEYKQVNLLLLSGAKSIQYL